MEPALKKHPLLTLIEVSAPEKLQRFSRLLDQAFQTPSGTHYFDDFPIWSVPKPDDYSVMRLAVETESGELAATVGVRLVSLKISGHGIYPVALIGAVATAEPYRGQGLASQIVAQALEWARHRGAMAALLWGSEHTLYAKLGFALCGTQAMLPLSESIVPVGPTGSQTFTINAGWHPAIFSLMMKRPDGVALSPADRFWIEAHRHVEWLWVGTPNAPRAYVAIGRGIDLQGMIHEWGGEREALCGLLAHLRETRSELNLLGSPARIAALGIDGNARVEPLFLATVLHPELAGLDPAEVWDPYEQARVCFGAPGEAPARLDAWIWGLDAV